MIGINFAEAGHSELVVFDAKPGGPPVVSGTENKVCGVGSRELDRPTSPLTADLVQRLRPYLPCPWRIRGYRSFHRSERETATYRLSMWLPTAGQWCS